MRLLTGAATLALLVPFAADAQNGTAAGATAGAIGGAVVGGPVGAVVGGVGGAIVGGLTDANTPKFREYGVMEYRYTIVNDRTVLVDPKTHKIVQIIG